MSRARQLVRIDRRRQRGDRVDVRVVVGRDDDRERRVAQRQIGDHGRFISNCREWATSVERRPRTDARRGYDKFVVTLVVGADRYTACVIRVLATGRRRVTSLVSATGRAPTGARRTYLEASAIEAIL